MSSEPASSEPTGQVRCPACGGVSQSGSIKCSKCGAQLGAYVEGQATPGARSLAWSNREVDISLPSIQRDGDAVMILGLFGLLGVVSSAVMLLSSGSYLDALIVLAICLGPPPLRMAVLLSRRRAAGLPISAMQWLIALVGSIGAIFLIVLSIGTAFFGICFVLGIGALDVLRDNNGTGLFLEFVIVPISGIIALALAVPMLRQLSKPWR